MNLGWIQDSVATLDFDDIRIAREFWKTHGPFRCALSRTRRGIHMVFRNPGVGNAVNVNGLYDVRGKKGYILCPGSRVKKHLYHFIDGYNETDPTKLDEFREEWMPKKTPVREFEKEFDMVIRARGYLKTVEGAISGSNGHSKTLYAACCLIHKFGLSVDQAWPLMLEYNESKCCPPWSAIDLKRKLSEAIRLRGNNK